MGGNPGKLLGITLHPVAAKPVERVAAALQADPQLDRQRAGDVVRYYLWTRSAPS